MIPQHLSFSQLNSFKTCPRAWYVQKILGEQQPTSDAASRGQQFDQLVSHKLGLGPVPEGALIERVEEAVELYTTNGGWCRADEAQKKIEIRPNQWEVMAEELGVPFRLQRPIIGYVDLFRRMGDGIRTELADLKTSERAEYRPDWSLQCALYCLATRAAKFEIHLVTFTKTIKLHRYAYRPSEDTFRWAMTCIGSIAEQLERAALCKSSEELPAYPSYACGWCPRQLTCEAALVGKLVVLE